MGQALTKKTAPAEEPEPAWEIAYLFPPQGHWSEDDYLALDTNRLVELSNGCLEVLPMPTTSHQLLLLHLYKLLLAFTAPANLGTALVAALPIRLWRKKFREPDIVFMLKDHADRISDEFWKGADLVMEVVSEGKKDRHRDLVTKRQEYARAGIPEYWIVDPQQERITVLRLAGKQYAVHGEFDKGSVASSHLLKGFTVDVTGAFANQLQKGAGKTKPRSEKPRRR
jgi:Uma2 family endonuclease